MKEVQLRIDLAPDGSGWSLSQDNQLREAYVWKTPDETSRGHSYLLVVPLSEEEQNNFSRNVVTQDGVTGLKVPNVNESYIEF